MSDLSREHCSPINATSLKLDESQIDQLMKDVDGWKLLHKDNEARLEKTFQFKDFNQALDFTNRIGQLANEEDHHPAILTEWGKVTVDWWTHKIKGLHRNDFIMAAKTDEIIM